MFQTPALKAIAAFRSLRSDRRGLVTFEFCTVIGAAGAVVWAAVAATTDSATILGRVRAAIDVLLAQ